MNIKEKVGLRIKALRDLNGLSQTYLSFDSDMDRSYLSGVEKGHRNVSIVNIEKIANALGISVEEFFHDESFRNVNND
ncbi:MAG: helix-turn-helix transcriptional regulator [Paludibacter sp.]|nr:helix-turn-helix transcriptional regulator [Paludibacter sp.]